MITQHLRRAAVPAAIALIYLLWSLAVIGLTSTSADAVTAQPNIDGVTFDCIDGQAFATVTLSQPGPGIFSDSAGTTGSFASQNTFAYPLVERASTVFITVTWTDPNVTRQIFGSYDCTPKVAQPVPNDTFDAVTPPVEETTESPSEGC